ncbi:hypothetical protein BIFDEN_01237 [Bifidobacterium dentium ATCC 27678]|nr:hypothetical protein BIFDEN_01237 [Bifidobacterium dentium ATCC 27678]
MRFGHTEGEDPHGTSPRLALPCAWLCGWKYGRSADTGPELNPYW